MRRLKNFMKCSLSLLLSLTLVISSTDMNVFAVEKAVVEISSEVVDLGEFSIENSGGLSLFNEENGVIDLKEGTYEKWIDRIDIPEYGIDLYNTMVEYSDNDGENDLFISEEGFSKDNAFSIKYGSYGTDTFNAIRVTTLTNPTVMEKNYVYALIRAVFDAFIMDHPEVFWLSGRTSSYQVNYSYGNGTKKCEFYMLLKMHEGSYSSSFTDFLAEDYKTESAILADIDVRDNAVNAILNSSAVQNAKNDYELVKAFNEWLTKNNEYNTLVSSGDSYGNFRAHNCLSALTGSEGTVGPVCEGYAEAFKILCDRKNIPCVLVTGPATSSPDSEGESHAWNITKINGSWYCVDVTWNDPVVSWVEGKVSGYENENYLLAGSETLHNGMQFQNSHITQNKVSSGSSATAFTNGPVLSRSKYVFSNEMYTISWDIDGDGNIDDSKQYAYNETPTHTDGVKPADAQFTYTFTGWSPEIASVTGDKTYTAQFNKTTNKYNISWDTDGDGNIDDVTNAAYGSVPSHSDGYKAADAQYTYTFTGWSPSLTAVTGDKTYTAQFDEKEIEKQPALEGVTRITGKSTAEISLLIADVYKEQLNVEKLDTVIVATASDFSDTLSAPYLAHVKNAPILLIDNTEYQEQVIDYINNNLKEDGVIYIIGGSAAVSGSLESELSDFSIIRIAGNNRYETNLAILEETGFQGDSIVVVNGSIYNENLSALALRMPILMVKNKWTSVQEEALEQMQLEHIYVIGDSSLISDDIVDNLKNYGTVERVFGADYSQTSVEIAKKFFDPTAAVAAHADDFAHALCGAPLASKLNIPLIISNGSDATTIADYMKETEINAGYVISEEFNISDDSIVDIFSLESANEIKVLGTKLEDDKTLPEAPGYCAFQADTTSIILSWEPSPADDISKYEIVDLSTNEVLMEVTGTTATLTGLESNTEYRFAIRAVDAAGNKSKDLIVAATTAKSEETNTFKPAEVFRIAGGTRTETSYKIAESLKAMRDGKKFNTIIVATSQNFADALSGSYLAAAKDAPIILVNDENQAQIIKLVVYMKDNLESDGTVYILGGEDAVSETVAESIRTAGFHLTRLADTGRYGTNLKILNEAGIEKGTDLILATGKNFGDSLSASALKKPILLVKPKTKNLTTEQKEILEKAAGGNIYIVGGPDAVDVGIENELKSIYGNKVVRIAGATTIDTSKKIAEYFFGKEHAKDVENVVIANSKVPYDGLCGGPLAAALDAPLLLTRDYKTSLTEDYIITEMPSRGYVLGGTTALSDQTVVDVFKLDNADKIN